MSNNKYFADIYVHLHSHGLIDDRVKIEKELRNSSGVFSVHFDRDETHNAMVVSYNPEAVSSDTLLDIIKNRYQQAVSVANILTSVSGE